MNVTQTFSVAVTPEDAAEAFCNMDDSDQADFFAEVARRSSLWGDGADSMQWMNMGVAASNRMDGGHSVRTLIDRIHQQVCP